MIQRIQTLFLLAILLISLGLWFGPIIYGELLEEQIKYKLTASSFSTMNLNEEPLQVIDDTSLLGWIFLIISLVSVGSIFAFKNRGLQIRLCYLNYFVIGVSAVVLANFWFSLLEDFPIDTISFWSIVRLFAFPAMLVFNLLAILNIKKDDDLVRASERLR